MGFEIYSPTCITQYKRGVKELGIGIGGACVCVCVLLCVFVVIVCLSGNGHSGSINPKPLAKECKHIRLSA